MSHRRSNTPKPDTGHYARVGSRLVRVCPRSVSDDPARAAYMDALRATSERRAREDAQHAESVESATSAVLRVLAQYPWKVVCDVSDRLNSATLTTDSWSETLSEYSWPDKIQ